VVKRKMRGNGSFLNSEIVSTKGEKRERHSAKKQIPRGTQRCKEKKKRKGQKGNMKKEGLGKTRFENGGKSASQRGESEKSQKRPLVGIGFRKKKKKSRKGRVPGKRGEGMREY